MLARGSPLCREGQLPLGRGGGGSEGIFLLPCGLVLQALKQLLQPANQQTTFFFIPSRGSLSFNGYMRNIESSCHLTENIKIGLPKNYKIQCINQ